MLTKFAAAEVLDVKGSKQRIVGAQINKIADYDDYRTQDGYLYVRIRAISSRTNKNHDGWPSIELAGSPEIFERHQSSEEGFMLTSADGNKDRGFATFSGKPIFVDHNNTDPRKSRGAIVDSIFRVLDHKTASSDDYWSKPDIDPEHLPASEIELLLEVDAKAYPKFAKAILDGELDGFSMGCDVDYSKCSHCGNKATSPNEYCEHIKLKGAEFKHPKTGKMSKAYENCYGVGFFEISGVFDPADETALSREVRAGVIKEAENPVPQSEMTKAPEEVDTLRKERICPVCGSDVDDTTCQVCGWEAPPDGFDNPDLHKDEDLNAQHQENQGPEVIPADPNVPPPAEGQGQSYLQTRKSKQAPAVRSDMTWTASVHPKAARYITAGDEPNDEAVVKDETKPVTSNNQSGEIMSDQTKVAGEPADPSGKPDKQVDVTGVGGVDEASNEEASKPEGKHGEPGVTVDVEGKGGVLQDSNEEAAKPDEKVDVAKEVRTDDSGPTKTFDNSNEPESAVTDKAVESAAKGAQPADPSGKPDERIDVEQPPHDRVAPGTDQWTGTGGNGVTKQQDPVTDKPTQSGGVKSNINTHIVTIFKLADAEVATGLIPEERKYDRIAELEDETEEAVQSQLAMLTRVKTAGFAKQASSIAKLPSLQKRASDEVVEEPAADDVLDSAIYSR